MKRERLMQERMKREKPRHVVADELGISVIYLRKMESGDAKPGRDIMIKLSEYYGLSLQELFPDLFLDCDDKKLITEE